jgi:hypothetical protein
MHKKMIQISRYKNKKVKTIIICVLNINAPLGLHDLD